MQAVFSYSCLSVFYSLAQDTCWCAILYKPVVELVQLVQQVLTALVHQAFWRWRRSCCSASWSIRQHTLLCCLVRAGGPTRPFLVVRLCSCQTRRPAWTCLARRPIPALNSGVNCCSLKRRPDSALVWRFVPAQRFSC